MRKKVVLVTGGSKGIGADIVKGLSEDGNIVILNYNKSEEQAYLIKKELEEKGIQIDIYKADITKREQVKNLVEFIIKKYSKIDVVVNNAGISQIKLFTDITDDDWNNMLQANLTSAFYVSQEVARYMINEKSGAIINISSVWGMVGASCEVHYSVAKAGLDGMTKALAKELGPSNIRVNSIAPGIMKTEMNSHLSDEDLKSITQEIPLEKIGYPHSITKCVKWLIEDDYTTGQVISVNGGWVI